MKVLVITGGSRGLGKELIDLYEKEDWKIFEFSRTGKNKFHNNLDLSNISNLSEKIIPIFNKITNNDISELLYINNASSLSPISRTYKLSDSDIITNININIVSTIIIIKNLIQVFRDVNCKKTIVNISTGASIKGYPGWSLYCTSKAGTENLMRTIYEEEQNEKYPFTLVNFDPYIMDTFMQEQIRNSDLYEFPLLEKFIAYQNDGKLLKPLVVANILKTLLLNTNLTELRYEAINLRSN